MQESLELPKITSDYLESILKRTGSKKLGRTREEDIKVYEDWLNERE